MARRIELRDLARGFFLLSDETRLGILKALAARPKSVIALCKTLGIRQTTMSHHIGLLSMGNLVIGTRTGKSVMYETDAASLKVLAAAIAKLTPRK